MLDARVHRHDVPAGIKIEAGIKRQDNSGIGIHQAQQQYAN
jgi:hypothetical protein